MNELQLSPEEVSAMIQKAKAHKKKIQAKKHTKKASISDNPILKLAFLGALKASLGGAAAGGLLGGAAGGLFAPSDATGEGALRGALLGAGVGALKQPLVSRLMSGRWGGTVSLADLNPNSSHLLIGSLLQLAPIASTAGGIAGGTTVSTPPNLYEQALTKIRGLHE